MLQAPMARYAPGALVSDRSSLGPAIPAVVVEELLTALTSAASPPAPPDQNPDLAILSPVQTAIVTGARGLGFEIGRGLARAGYRVVFGVRSAAIGEAAASRIVAETPDARVEAQRLDLADLETVAAFARGIERVDLLVNNAGIVMPEKREVTVDGFELHMGTNHLGHFALVAQLLPKLRAANSPRVVVVGSLGHRLARLELGDLQFEQRPYRRFAAYAQSKLANLLFMSELQRRSDAHGWGLTSVGAHPGFAATEALSHQKHSRLREALDDQLRRFVPTSEQAARSVLLAATDRAIIPAGYYGPSGFMEIAGPPAAARLSEAAQDPDLGAKLWSVSEALTGVRFPENDRLSLP
jgi:NAD(P)-dependent dehydrogenase (short-subunit alcohol dehydrogenase family)